MRKDAKAAAKFLFESGLTIGEYEELQMHRKERLDLWLDRRIEVIAKGEMQLITYGDEILVELKKLYDRRSNSIRGDKNL